MHFARNLTRGANSNMFLVAKDVKKKNNYGFFTRNCESIVSLL